jgi:hypothetical protein
MAPKYALIFALITYLGLMGCNNPKAIPQASNEPAFDFSSDSQFNWNLKKTDLESSHLQVMSNSKIIRARFAGFGEVEYQLFFDWNSDQLSMARITLVESGDIKVILDTLYDVYIYFYDKKVSFDKYNYKLGKAEFIEIIQRQTESPHSPKPVYLSINSAKRNYILLFIDSTFENDDKKYQAVLQISRS